MTGDLQAGAVASPQRIYLTGASGSGVTTLGTALAGALDARLIDVDDVFWLPTDPPYTTRRPPEERIALIRPALQASRWVLSGSFDGWGGVLLETCDLVVFLTVPADVRMARTRAREAARFGARIAPGGDMHAQHLAFLDWSASYDDPAATGRSRHRHEAWLAGITLPVLRLDGRDPVTDLVRAVLGGET